MANTGTMRDFIMLKWLWLSLLALVLDQGSKLAIAGSMKLYESIQIMPFFKLTYVHNTGAAFSFLSEAGGWQRWFFAGLALAISVVIAVWLTRLKKHETLLAVALALVLGGAVGNLIDRLAYGYVIDFLDVYYESWHWPAFNIADSAITLGVVLMLAESFGLVHPKEPDL
ncbi:signal peptidase II [Methylobacter tundripaludum]|uniref:Lipoprotein signal peptidase n=2 Tax=Methylobacter tundripaludum TaxID=173365 RepID=A0A2S6HJ28_9GAMM|nr:signal peptidase II [Methylobacter tundripaludum]